MIDPPAERIVDVVLRGVGAKTPTSPLPARRLHRLTGRRGGFALLFLTNKIDRIPSFDIRQSTLVMLEFLYRSDWPLAARGDAYMNIANDPNSKPVSVIEY